MAVHPGRAGPEWGLLTDQRVLGERNGFHMVYHPIEESQKEFREAA